MNGRIYDPQIGRFLSADRFIQYPGNLQSYNRYSYVMNNPLSKNDPTGYLETTVSEEDAKRLKDSTDEINKRVNDVVQSVLSDVKSGKISPQDAARAVYNQLVGLKGKTQGGNNIALAVAVQSKGKTYVVAGTLKGSLYEGGLPATEKSKELFMNEAREIIGNAPGISKFAEGIRNKLIDKLSEKAYNDKTGTNSDGQTVWNEETLAGGLNVGGNAIGTDKLDHMFFDGFHVAKYSEQKALQVSQEMEEGLNGLEMTGVYSNADIVANMNGRQFYHEVFNAAKDGTEFQFDIRNYDVSGMDENKNPNRYSPELQKTINRNLKK